MAPAISCMRALPRALASAMIGLTLAVPRALWKLAQDGAVPFSVPGGPVIPVVTVLLIGWLFTSITVAEWTVLAATLAVASLIFVIARRTLTPMTVSV